MSDNSTEKLIKELSEKLNITEQKLNDTEQKLNDTEQKLNDTEQKLNNIEEKLFLFYKVLNSSVSFNEALVKKLF